MIMGADIKSTFPPGIYKYIEKLLRHGKIGICAGTLRLFDVNTGCSRKVIHSEMTVSDLPNGDRFKLAIPYAGHSVSWEVLFNCYQPEEPPDFIFGPDDGDFNPDICNIRSLAQWDAHDPAALLNVICELMEEYRIYQKGLIAEKSVLQYEYNTLISAQKFKEQDLEVFVKKHGDKFGPVSFLMKLPVNFARIPAYLIKDDAGEDTAVLVVTYATPDGGKVTPQLFLSPRVEKALGASGGLRIPGFPLQGSLEDYVPLILETLENQIDEVVAGFEKKKDYVSAFLALYGGSIIEYDIEGFSRLSFLMEWHDFFFQISIDLPVTFPTDQPQLTFLSVYHMDSDGGQFSKRTTDYPYSPRWSAQEMAIRAKAYILEQIGNFQKYSVREGAIMS